MKAWLKDNGPVIGALAAVIVAFVAVLQLAVVGPMNRGFADLRSEMNGRFEAMDQRFDDLRAEMNQRFDHQDKYMNARFNAIDERFGSVDRRIGAVEQRLHRLTDEVSDLRILVTGIGERVSRNDGQIEVIREQLQTVDAPEP